MALSASQSRATTTNSRKSSWTTNLLDINHFPSADGSRIDDSRVVHLVGKHSNNSSDTINLRKGLTKHDGMSTNNVSSKKNKQEEKKRQKKENTVKLAMKNSQTAKHLSLTPQPHEKVKNTFQDRSYTSNNQGDKKNSNDDNSGATANDNTNKKSKIFSGALKKLFSRRKCGKYEECVENQASSNKKEASEKGGENAPNTAAPPIVVKEYDPTSTSVIRFNTYSRSQFSRDSSSVVLFDDDLSSDKKCRNDPLCVSTSSSSSLVVQSSGAEGIENRGDSPGRRHNEFDNLDIDNDITSKDSFHRNSNGVDSTSSQQAQIL